MFDYFINCSGYVHHVYHEDTQTKVIYGHCQSVDLDLHSSSQVPLKYDYFLTCNISDTISAITFELGMAVKLWMPYILMLVSKTLILIKGHSGSAKANNQR